MLEIILFTLFILACVVLVVAVLLQPGKADAGALFTSSVSTTAFGPRGTQTVLAKITIGAAATFMLAALFISAGVGSDSSVMRGADFTPTPTPAASPAAEASPAAAAPQTEGAASPAAPAQGTQSTTVAPATTTASPAASPAPASPETK